MKKVQRAIISVTNKMGIEEFAKELAAMGVEIISTGGTADLIKKAGVNVIPISSYTGFPEMLDGRLKTLHPKIHGGILGIRSSEKHKKDMDAYGILPIDMVVVNLYAFEDTVAKGCSIDEAIENIDIGGPTMLRSAAKNYKDVAVVVDPSDYSGIIAEMKGASGMLSAKTRAKLSRKVFQTTARYDAAISNYLGSIPEIPEAEPKKRFPDTFTFQYRKVQDLRYGENPHQSAAFYSLVSDDADPFSSAKQLNGKDLSFNNILDLNAAYSLVAEFAEPACVIVKHNNPCGVSATKKGLLQAYLQAYECDKTSAFGGIVAFNRTVTKALADELGKLFIEAIISPGYDPDALEALRVKKNLRLMEVKGPIARKIAADYDFDIKRVAGGALLQTPDNGSASDLKVVTKRAPTDSELEDLLFAWHVCKHVKSNAIIIAKDARTIGIGAGQMSRIDSTRVSVMKAEDAGLTVAGSVLASDAFFPFKDNVELAYRNGITAIIQPGGSIKDEEVIKAADEAGIAMVFTGIRHFRH